jgi:hypothetical protein
VSRERELANQEKRLKKTCDDVSNLWQARFHAEQVLRALPP